MADKMKEIKFDRDRFNALKEDKRLTPLARAFVNCADYVYGQDGYHELASLLKGICGQDVWRLPRAEDFLVPKVIKALAQLTDADYAASICEIVHLIVGTQFSRSSVRRAFRSDSFSYYGADSMRIIAGLIRQYYYNATVSDLIRQDSIYGVSLEYTIALAIRRRNPDVCDSIRDMILGDNNTLLSHSVINGIILSGNPEMLGLLMDLLLAAKGQEGIRQAILESADAGSLDTFRMIFKTCIDNDLFRFSSAARSLFTWTGVGLETLEIPATRRLAETAWNCLNEDAYRQEMLDSANPYDAYLAVWAMGCHEVKDTDRYVEKLVQDPKTYRRSLGWFFVSSVENTQYCHNMAVKHLDEPEDEVLARIMPNLYSNHQATWYSSYSNRDFDVKALPSDSLPASRRNRRALFDRLKPLVVRIGNRKETFRGNPFPWSEVQLSNESSNGLKCMVSLAAYDLDEEMIRELFDLLDYMNVELRQAFYANLLEPTAHPQQREYLYLALKDRSIETKEMAIKKLGKAATLPSDIQHICALLVSQSASLRKTAVSYLKDRDLVSRKQAVEILAQGTDSQLQVAMELLLQDKSLASSSTSLIDSLKERKLSSQAQLLLQQLVGMDQEALEYGPDNGYGLYQSEVIDQFVEELDKDSSLAFYEDKHLTLKPQTGAFRYLKKREIQDFFTDVDEVNRVYAALNHVIQDHSDYEYSYLNHEGQREHCLLGDLSYRFYIPEKFGNFYQINAPEKQFHMLPFAEEFRQVLKPYMEDPLRLLGLTTIANHSQYYSRETYPDKWLSALHELGESCDSVQFRNLYQNRIYLFREIIALAAMECDHDLLFDGAFRYYFSMMHLLGDSYMDYIRKPYERGFGHHHKTEDLLLREAINMLKTLTDKPQKEEKFRLWFLSEYRLRRRHGFMNSNLGLNDFLRAVDQDLISKEALCEWLLHPDRTLARELETFTSLHNAAGQKLVPQYPWLPDLSARLTDHIVRFEVRRGQAETPISTRVSKVARIVGADYFNLLLRGLGSDNFFRGYIWSGNYTKPAVLSLLLRHCQPGPEDNADTLRRLLKGSDIKEKRLVEAAMYAPHWAPIIEEYIGWPGLKKGVWFFQAHCSEAFSSDKETEVALYSPITPQEFNDGAFDIDWFRSAYEELGDKRFTALYKSAKYITEGSNAHRRSQLYTDAVTGKLGLATIEAEIRDKRNQEKLRAYALIPLSQGTEADSFRSVPGSRVGTDDSAPALKTRSDGSAPALEARSDSSAETGELLRRYEFLMEFQKGSKQFGAQKRESEKKAVATALANLAVTCGLGDVNRMLWRLESAKNAELLPLMTPVTLGDYRVVLQIDQDGVPSVVVSKDGKTLKTLPKALAKNEYIDQLKQAAKDLRDQKSRSRVTLEQAMINRTVFSQEELANMMSSLTVAPMAAKLLWINEAGEIGFLKPITGSGNDGSAAVIPYITGHSLRIAHCYDLAVSGKWGEYIHYAFDNQLIQPFKQIFREYYPVTDEEKEEIMLSRRYAGYQVQPRKTMGLLKSCGWTVDYEEGLQKVCYGADMVVRMYSNADWFSPADIEAPTLEEIRFYRRRTWEAIPLTDIDPILFSEVMRDFDLVVSTAYVGGVDPATSHSTVEMRAAIARELTLLLKLSNVTFLERHARIVGKLGEYSVHLGSGIVHAADIGMIPILPVHSQHRGRIFLPFADEDPKTAEIMSKIILLSEDHKIKDPEILQYL